MYHCIGIYIIYLYHCIGNLFYYMCQCIGILFIWCINTQVVWYDIPHSNIGVTTEKPDVTAILPDEMPDLPATANIKSIASTPESGIGKPEKLKGALSGFWSRRINKEHRIIYSSWMFLPRAFHLIIIVNFKGIRWYR